MAGKRDFLLTARGLIRQRVTQKVVQAIELSKTEVVSDVVKEVSQHKLSQAISSHSTAFMPKAGTLFGLMGFQNGSNPVEKLIAFLKSPSAFRSETNRQTIAGTTGVISVLKLPTSEDFVKAEITTDGWSDGRSWPEMVESGISGLSRYLAAFGYGRSEEGLQVKHKVWDEDNLKGITYLTPILKRAKRKFLDKIKRRSAAR